jgi:hypothetical protein
MTPSATFDNFDTFEFIDAFAGGQPEATLSGRVGAER